MTTTYAAAMEGFSYAGPYASRVACDTCGRLGYPGGKWQDACRRGHAPCRRCGRQSPVRLDGTARTHTRCPNRPTEEATRA